MAPERLWGWHSGRRTCERSTVAEQPDQLAAVTAASVARCVLLQCGAAGRSGLRLPLCWQSAGGRRVRTNHGCNTPKRHAHNCMLAHVGSERHQAAGGVDQTQDPPPGARARMGRVAHAMVCIHACACASARSAWRRRRKHAVPLSYAMMVVVIATDAKKAETNWAVALGQKGGTTRARAVPTATCTCHPPAWQRTTTTAAALPCPCSRRLRAPGTGHQEKRIIILYTCMPVCSYCGLCVWAQPPRSDQMGQRRIRQARPQWNGATSPAPLLPLRAKTGNRTRGPRGPRADTQCAAADEAAAGCTHMHTRTQAAEAKLLPGPGRGEARPPWPANRAAALLRNAPQTTKGPSRDAWRPG